MKREERNKLVLKNIGLVHKVAKMLDIDMDYQDKIQEGTIGLIKAVEMYNPKRCRQFSTYACVCIRSHIIRAYQNTGNFMRIPVPYYEHYSKIKRVKGFADMFFDNKYDFEYLSEETKLPIERIKKVLEACHSYAIDLEPFQEAIPDIIDIDQRLDCKNTLEFIDRKMSNYTNIQKNAYRDVFLEGAEGVTENQSAIYMIRKKLRKLFEDGVPECLK